MIGSTSMVSGFSTRPTISSSGMVLLWDGDVGWTRPPRAPSQRAGACATGAAALEDGEVQVVRTCPYPGGMPRPAQDWKERFWAKVDKDGPEPEHRPDLGPCWLWTTGRFSGAVGGYGQFWRCEGQNLHAHRVAYELLVGPIPYGLHLDHLCRVRHCVNPKH